MIKLDACSFNLSQIQVKQVSKILNAISDYIKFLDKQQSIYQAYVFRPNRYIRNEADAKSKSSLTRQWWKYAQKAVSNNPQRQKAIHYLLRACKQINRKP